MSSNIKDQLLDLLDKIFIFDYDFKLSVSEKISGENEQQKLEKLKTIFLEALKTQEDLLEKKIQGDKQFYEKIKRKVQDTDKSIIKIYASKMQQEDKNKINIILSKVNSI